MTLPRNLFNHLQRSVVVAVPVVRMMQFAVNQIINVIAVRHSGVAAAGTVNVLPVVAFCAERAFVWIRGADGDDVFIHVIAVRMMQMSVMKIIHMPIVHDGRMPAVFAVNVGMIGMCRAGMGFIHRRVSVWAFMFGSTGELNHGHRDCGKKCFCKSLA